MDIAAYGPVFDRSGGRRLELRVIGPAKAGALVKIAGVEDRDAAEGLRGLELHVPRSALPALQDAEEFYQADLIGMAAEGPAGEALGRVVAVQDFGAGPVLEIRGPAGELLLPFTREVVPLVDLQARRLQVVPPAVVEARDGGADGPAEAEG